MESTGYLRTLQRHLLLIVSAAIAGLLVAGVATLVIAPSYRATATLFLKVTAASTSLYERSQFALQRIQSYPQLLDSPSLLQTVKSDLDLPQSTQQLAKQITGTNPTNTVLLNVTADAATPREAAAIANDAARTLATNVNALENTQTTSKNAVALNQEIVAQAPDAPSAPNKPVVLGLGLLGGLVVGVLLALLFEGVRPRLRTAADVRRALGLPLVAQLAWQQTRRRRAVGPGTAASDAVMNLRALGRGVLPPVLLLAPADARAAAPITRFLLAAGAAQGGRRVAVLETDRSAPLPRGIDLPQDADRAVPQRSVPGLEVVPLRQLAAGETDAEVEQGFAAELQKLAADYDTVVLQGRLDSSPVRLDVVAPAARGAFIVVSRRSTSLRDARRVLAHLRVAGVVPIGVIMVDGPSNPAELFATWREDDFVQVVSQDDEPGARVRPFGPRRLLEPVHADDRQVTAGPAEH